MVSWCVVVSGVVDDGLAWIRVHGLAALIEDVGEVLGLDAPGDDVPGGQGGEATGAPAVSRRQEQDGAWARRALRRALLEPLIPRVSNLSDYGITVPPAGAILLYSRDRTWERQSDDPKKKSHHSVVLDPFFFICGRFVAIYIYI
jgi:hypothetical protein